MEQEYWIPRNLDASKMFFIWELDRAMVAILSLIILSTFGLYFTGVIVTYFISKGYAHLKEEGGQGLVIRLLYWVTPSDMWLSPFAASNIREYSN